MKDYIEDELRERHITILANFDVKGAFDAAWWPNILKTLKEFQCPKNLYNLAKSYFSERTATLSINSIHVDKDVRKGCPQGSCCGLGFWNLQYNTLLNLEFGKRTKAIAFADDLLIAVRAENVREAEHLANREVNKISKWAEDNKITFSEQKSKVIVVTRRKR